MIAALLAILFASPGVAGVSAGGQVSVWRAETGRWTAIYQCRRPPVARRRLAWAGPVLFIACPGEPLARWEVGEPVARAVTNRALALRRPTVLGDGPVALFFAEARAVWRYRPGVDLVERLAAAPEWPLASIAETPIGLLVRGRAGCWQWRRGTWRRLQGSSPVHSTGLDTPIECEGRFARQPVYTRKLANLLRDPGPSRHVSTVYAAARSVHWIRPMDAVHPKQESTVADRNKAVRILAKSIFRELTAQGYNEKQIVSLATALLNEVTVKISGSEARP